MSTNNDDSGAGTSAGTTQTSAAATGRYNLPLPTFWLARPELWFLQAESVFQDRIPPVTVDKLKFNMVLRALPNEVLEKVEHVLTGEAQVGRCYPALKSALIESYGTTPRQQACKTHSPD